MPRRTDPLSLWRGYVAHALFFYRQNDRPKRAELAGLGDAVPFGLSAHPPIPAGTRALIARGLSKPETYWGSLRLGDAALKDFETAALREPNDPWGLLLAGMTHEMQRRYTRAIACFERAAELAPSWPWPHILRGICNWYQAEFRESVADFQRALAVDPECVCALLFLSRAKSDLRDRSLVADLDRAEALAPEDPFVLSWRGRAKFIVDRTPESLDDLRRAAKLLPRYDRSWSWLGISLMELGRVKEALPLLAKADRLNPFYPTTLYPLARAQMKLGRVAAAGKTLERAAAVDRSGVWVEHRISMSHPNPACLRSIDDLNKYIELRAKSSELREAAWALAWRGQTKLLLREYRAALADFDAASKAIHPRHPKPGTASWIHVWRGETFRRLGYVERSLKEFESALKLDKTLSWAWAGKGFCLLELGKKAAATAALERSLKLQPRCPQALAWRGDAAGALELRPQYAKRPKSGDTISVDGVPGSFGRDVMIAYCREKESPACAAAFAAGDLKGALALAAPSGNEIRSFLFRGWLKLNTGDAEGAVEEASRALDDGLDPGNPAALWLREQALGKVSA